MSSEKLSISLESELAASVRNAAAESGVSVSTWLADAAEARVRQRKLRAALDALAQEIGSLSADEVDELVSEARRDSVVVEGAKGAA